MKFKDHLLETKRTAEQALLFLKRHGMLARGTVNERGEIDSDELLMIKITGDTLVRQLPKFGTVKGVKAVEMDLTSLASWAPHTVIEGFNVSANKLKTFKGGPKSVGGKLDVSYNQLKTFKHFPAKVGSIDVQANQLTSFEDAPAEVGGNFDVRFNRIISLKDINKHVKRLDGLLLIHGNPIIRNVLGLFMIEGLKGLSFNRVEAPWGEIVSRHLKQGRDGLIDCQHELIERGYEELAQL